MKLKIKVEKEFIECMKLLRSNALDGGLWYVPIIPLRMYQNMDISRAYVRQF